MPAPPVAAFQAAWHHHKPSRARHQWWQSCHCWWESPNMCHPLERFCKIWSHPTVFLVKMHKHFAVQGLHFQQKLRFQQQSHGRHHWLLVCLSPQQKWTNCGADALDIDFQDIYRICMRIGWSAKERVAAPPVASFQASWHHHIASHARHQWWQSCHCWWSSSNMCHRLE